LERGIVQPLAPATSRQGLELHGLRKIRTAFWNLTAPTLYEEALQRREGRLACGGALVVETGHHRGRSPNDKFIVEEPSSKHLIWWGSVNRPISEQRFAALHEHVLAHLEEKDAFVQDCYAGADRAHRLAVRVVTESAWHSLFAHNMFIRPSPEALEQFAPDFTVIQAPTCRADPSRHGTTSETFILINFKKRLVIIGGSSYAGEIKKSVFSVLNHLLPARGVLPMHAAVNVGPQGDAAIFFGLSGTGKTTLSADATRTLIGDDEHGWSDNGLFNFEGGCYAKVIRLSPQAEPEIYETTRRFGTILENVTMHPERRSLDLDDSSLTENTRASYPIGFIPNASQSGVAGQPENVIMLTADAFGVLPPISRLTPEQAMYHFLSGYTARVAGTEKGLGKDPEATFSACFGAPFMPRHPTVYAKLLGERIARHNVKCWLVNTGWSGGPYGVGRRMDIAHTRAMVRAALDGPLAQVPTARIDAFGLLVPRSCPGVPSEVLDPRATWRDQRAYDRMAREVAKRFETNFKQFEPYVDEKVKAAAIHATS
jgi:phosphoenolpyruvate carboxykinase (ATP)